MIEEARELLNAAASAFFLCLSYRFFRVVIDYDYETTPRMRTAAAALFFIFVGEILRSSVVWFSLAAERRGWSIPYWMVGDASIAVLVAVALIMIGALGAIYIFRSPNSSGYGETIFAAVLATGCLLATIFI